MPIIRAVNGIVEMHPALAVSPRPPATQVAAAGRKDRSNRQERQPADYATHLAQKAYPKQMHQVSALKAILLAQDLMISPVTWLPSDSRLLEAWTVMKCMGTHHLPATSVRGTLVGMTSNHDLLSHAHELESINSPGPFATHKLAHEMSCRVLSPTSTTEICEIAHVLLDEHEGAIPIFDSPPHLVGILTTSDILRAIVHRSPLELWT
jgi:acetoin utilization protein AcuB